MRTRPRVAGWSQVLDRWEKPGAFAVSDKKYKIGVIRDISTSMLIKLITTNLRPGCIKRCQLVVKVNILSSDLIGGYLTLNLN
jgi:hypothetical protein